MARDLVFLVNSKHSTHTHVFVGIGIVLTIDGLLVLCRWFWSIIGVLFWAMPSKSQLNGSVPRKASHPYLSLSTVIKSCSERNGRIKPACCLADTAPGARWGLLPTSWLRSHWTTVISIITGNYSSYNYKPCVDFNFSAMGYGFLILTSQSLLESHSKGSRVSRMSRVFHPIGFLEFCLLKFSIAMSIVPALQLCRSSYYSMRSLFLR